ncbi:hypothetical protein NHX12_010922 [Muraenolepis orangiensis]|uniref:Uncharacterized protein n=1 Tax=Muraenolepis orangiensis TaxID=630683 RepID=A0A9Q0DF85_9TELE|nr:hypothetical protein NHX12_010922 [Muraenolepis orangiensis]
MKETVEPSTFRDPSLFRRTEDIAPPDRRSYLLPLFPVSALLCPGHRPLRRHSCQCEQHGSLKLSSELSDESLRRSLQNLTMLKSSPRATVRGGPGDGSARTFSCAHDSARPRRPETDMVDQRENENEAC